MMMMAGGQVIGGHSSHPSRRSPSLECFADPLSHPSIRPSVHPSTSTPRPWETETSYHGKYGTLLAMGNVARQVTILLYVQHVDRPEKAAIHARDPLVNKARPTANVTEIFSFPLFLRPHYPFFPFTVGDTDEDGTS